LRFFIEHVLSDRVRNPETTKHVHQTTNSETKMAAFNKTKKKSAVSAAKAVPVAVRQIVNPAPTTKNLAGGQAFRLTPQYELAFLMLTTFLDNEFYRTPGQTVQQLRELMLKTNDPVFVAKAAIYARTVYGMRSVSHLVAADIAKGIKGATWTKNFFDKVVYRVDDAAEILAAYMTMHKKPIPNSLKKGLALSLGKFNKHQLAKYKGANKGVKLVDLFNLVHPKPNATQAAAFKDLINGDLASSDTWESELSAAGQESSNPVEKAANKAAAWKSMVCEGKIGYFALLRNLRNILEQADDETVKAACVSLVNVEAIKRSLVLPFRFMTAQAEIAKLPTSSKTRMVTTAINKAIEISLSNVPEFDGETLVVLDDSGSMMSGSQLYGAVYNPQDTKSPAAIGSLFASVLAKRNNADMMLFNDKARYMNYNPTDSVMSITENIRKCFTSGGTDFHTIFKTANKKYDRIIILSDMQGGVGHTTPQADFGSYCAKFKASPKVYSFDLKGYGTLQFPQPGVFCLAGFSEKTMELMKVLEEDPNALIKAINEIEL